MKGASRLVVLSGLPGSGKSTLSESLVSLSDKKSPNTYVVVSTDQDGKDWLDKLSKELKRAGGNTTIILDRVNPTPSSRLDLLEKGREFGAKVVELVYFDVDKEECEKRAVYRTLTSGHPTVKPGKELKAINGAFGSLEPPGNEEFDKFDKVHIIKSAADTIDALRALSNNNGSSELLPHERFIRRMHHGRFEYRRSLVYFPPLDSHIVRSVRELQTQMSEGQTSLVDGSIQLEDLHITILGPKEIKASGVTGEGLLSRLESLAAEFLPQLSKTKTDAVPRFGANGNKRTAFLMLRNQDIWRNLVARLLPTPISVDRCFHVSIWNNSGGDPHESIGALHKGMDKNGDNFIKMFGVMTLEEDWSANEIETAPSVSSSYIPREMTLTDEEFRRGNTCRRNVRDVECQFKFPRTFHIVDTGNMEADDLLLSATERSIFLGNVITAEEKIDGANVGISLDPVEVAANGKPAFRFQKRSHFVSVHSEPQFRGLDKWADQHRVALLRLLRMPLGLGKAKAGQRIVFGEWLAATHSKPYDNLPSRFILFDVFDAELRDGRGGFLSVKNRDKLLAKVNTDVAKMAKLAADDPEAKVWRVRAVCNGRTFASTDDLLDLMNSNDGLSVYIAGDDKNKRRVEGMYLRVDDDSTGLLQARVKLVHPNFHRMLEEGRWEGGGKNSVRNDLWWGLDDDGKEHP